MTASKQRSCIRLSGVEGTASRLVSVSRGSHLKSQLEEEMSTEVFFGLLIVFVLIGMIPVLLGHGSPGSPEEQDRRRMSDDVNRMRQLQDIKYYRDIFRGNNTKD